MSVVAAEERRGLPSLRVSVAVPTRNRSAHVLQCVQAILALRGFTDIIVVDQSDDDSTRDELSRVEDPRLRYVRSDTRGVANGRNLAMSLSDSDVILFTDDDCRVTPDWVQKNIDIFAADPEVAVICGRVIVPDEIQKLG